MDKIRSLYLNVFTPDINTTNQALLPVMVWIHGGSWFTGSGSSSLYRDPPFFNQDEDREVVFVSINYRLGALGYLSLESIANETGQEYNGGLNGIIDQIVALQWVQNNIEDFGGDPSKVTIFGESAGAISICMLISTASTMVNGANLFDKAVIQSGPCLGFPTGLEVGLNDSLTALENFGLEDDLEALRAMDATEFIQLGMIGPNADGLLFTDPIDETTAFTEMVNTNKLLMGFNSMDSLNAFPFFAPSAIDRPPETENELALYLNTYLNNDSLVDRIKDTYYPIDDFKEASYGEEDFTSFTMLWWTINADICFICNSWMYAEALSAPIGVNQQFAANDMYLYLFNGAEPYYIPHAGELAFLFNSTLAAESNFGINWNGNLSQLMIENWINFAVYGKPNSTLFGNEWIAYAQDGVVMKYMDNDGSIEGQFINEYRNGVCNFWFGEVDFESASNLCSQNIAVDRGDNNETDDEFEWETWQIVALSLGGAAFFACVFIMWRWQCKREKGAYSLMNEPTQDTQLATATSQYGSTKTDSRL